jgi:ABC-type sugar transport system ATPase subunit
VLELTGVQKTYGPVTALAGVDLDVRPGEIVALAGPSGAGKTTTLHIGSGVLAASAGTITLNGRDISKIPAWKRDIALVQESYALYPHFTVFDNIAFPLRSPRVGTPLGEAEIERRVIGTAEVVEIAHLLKNSIQHLSGGQRQRVALARALVREPAAFLLDEPIAHLDAKLRHWLRGELRRRLIAAGRPCIWATPDGHEALSVADRIAVIVQGRIAQFGDPKSVFLNPATARVAEVVSEPPISILTGAVDREGPQLRVDGIPKPLPLRIESGNRLVPGPVLAAVRPSSLRFARGGNGAVIRAQVMAREFTTRETVVSLQLGTQSLRVLADPFSEFQVDQEVDVDWEGAKVYLFEVEKERRLMCHARVQAGSSGATREGAVRADEV